MLFVAICLSSCGKGIDADTIFADFSEAYALSGGTAYFTGVTEGPTALSNDLFLILYGRVDGTSERDCVTSAAVWLGGDSDTVLEWGVFVCLDRECAEQVALMCEQRLALCATVSFADTSSLSDAFVRIYGHTVVYSALPDNPRAERVLDRLF